MLGNIVEYTNPLGTTVYQYGIYGTNAVNKPENIYTPNGINENYYYNSLGRLTSHGKTIDGNTYSTNYNYDNYGKLTSKYYNNGYNLSYTYNKGYLTRINQPSGAYLFNANGTDINGRGQYKSYQLGNGKTTFNTYSDGYLTGTSTPGVQDLVMNYNYQTGNLTYRDDQLKDIRESFLYDNLNRLTRTQVNDYGIALLRPPLVVDYHTFGIGGAQTLGRIKSKTTLGNYAGGPYRMANVQNTNSMISNDQQDIKYTPFRMTEKVTEGNYEQTFTYDASHSRVMTEVNDIANNSPVLKRIYLDDYEVNVDPNTGATKYIHYISGGDGLCTIAEIDGYFVNNADADYHYIYKDHLGSIVTATNATGIIEVEQNFDAWGRERDPDQWTYPAPNPVGVGLTSSWLYRGYTGHEHMPYFTIINMNGRMYDPILGVMMSPDKYIHGGTQGYNRNAYALNNPLRYVDPDGNEPVMATVATAAIIGAIISAGSYTIRAALAPGGLNKNWNFGQFAFSTGMGAVGGVITHGIGGAFGEPFTYGVGGEIGRAGAHAWNGYIFSGGNASGAAVGFMSSVIGMGTEGLPLVGTDVGRTILAATLGGVTAEMTGGEFWYGAGQAAAIHLLNQIKHKTKPKLIEQAETGDGSIEGKWEADYNYWINGTEGNIVTRIAETIGDGFASASVDDNVNFAVTVVTAGISGRRARFIHTGDGIVDLHPTLSRINSGKRFPHRNDGTTFGNREGLLPSKPASHYTEYVVPTPGIKGPGPMRIVTGKTGEIWFTPNHYKSFIKIQ